MLKDKHMQSQDSKPASDFQAQVSTTTLHNLEMGPREGKQLAQGHTGTRWQNLLSEAGSLNSQSRILSTALMKNKIRSRANEARGGGLLDSGLGAWASYSCLVSFG